MHVNDPNGAFLDTNGSDFNPLGSPPVAISRIGLPIRLFRIAFVPRVLVLGMCMLIAFCLPARAQTQDNVSVVTAPVMIDGNTLFRVRGTTAYPAEQRAADITARIVAFAADAKQSPESLRVVEGEHGTEIFAGNTRLLVVIDEDSRIEGTSRQLLAHIYATSISQAVAAYRKDRAYSQLVRNVLLTAVSTILLGLAVFLLVKIFSLTNRFIVKRYHNRIEKIEAQSFRLIHARSILAVTRAIIITLTAIIAAGGVYAYLQFVLNLYPWTRRLADGLLHFLLAPLGAVATSILLAIPGLIVVAMIILAARYLLKMTRLFFNAIRDKQISLAGFDAEWADPTMRIVRLLIIVCAAIVAYPYIPGSDSAAFKGVTIFAGLLFSLGSSSLIANLIAGYTMTYRRAFHVGDRIAIGNTIGDVTAIRLMVTHLRSLKNEEIVIPNSAILASEVKNYSSLARNKGLILHTTIGIGYETPWRQVEAMLLMAASRTPGILSDPPPYILQKTLGDFSISYELNAYIDQPLAMYQLYTALHRSILDVFNEYGVQIMTPAYVADPAEPKIVPKERWVAAPAPVTGAPADQSVTTPLPQSNASTVVTLSSRQT